MRKLDKSLLVLLLSTILLLFAISYHTVVEFDQDLGRHLLLGKIIIESVSVPKVNLLSFTFSEYPFINSHWLAEVVFAGIGNIKALLWLKVLIFVSAFFLTILTAYKYSKSLWATALAFAFMAPILLERTEIRPEIFSFLFIAVFMYILLLKNKFWWTLPVIEVLWVNTHIYFFLGPLLTLLFFNKKQWYLPIVVCLVTLVNPNFLSGALFPLTVFGNYGYSIVENQHIFFLREVVSNPNINYFFVAVGMVIVSLLLTNWKKLTLRHWAWLSLIILPFVAIRNFPLFFLLLLPLVAFFIANTKLNAGKYANYIVIAVIALTLLRGGRLLTNQYYQATYSAKGFGGNVAESGKGVMDFVLSNNLKGPIFNNFDMGSYIAYRSYPQLKVFVDGRPEAYPKDFFQQVYIPMQMSADNFALVDKEVNFQTIIFSHRDATPWGQAFLQTIISNPGYRLVYLDDYAVVFTKGGDYAAFEPKTLLNKTGSFESNLYLGRVAELFGWGDVADGLLQKALVIKPSYAEVLKGQSPLVLF